MTSEPHEYAKHLRKRSTEAEKILWQRLKAKQLRGIKFRRQQRIGKIIVDFVSFENNLVVELDGGQHHSKSENDEKRDAWLASQGFTVLRFWNNDVLRDTDAVVEAIDRRMR